LENIVTVTGYKLRVTSSGRNKDWGLRNKVKGEKEKVKGKRPKVGGLRGKEKNLINP
jgi:hypothetical protein